MRIGAVLADARWRTHLTVDEVSRRTKIREAVIWGIEQDDFSVCGGDAYARGHIRAIAQAVEIDAEPLIRQYDQTYRANEDTGAAAPPPPPPPPSPGHDPQPTRRRRLVITTALAVVVLGLIGWGAYHVATGVGHPAHSQAVAAAGHPSASHSAGVVGVAGQGSPQPSPTPTTPSASSTPSASPTPTPSPTHAAATPSKALSLASVTPFGPGGEGTGDNPQTADLAIDGSSGSAWHSDWYTSAAFGNLKSGTGLLIDLGRGATINDADLDLGGYSGADLQLQAGNSPVPSALHEVASARDAGSTVRLNVGHSARARYVVIWFTQLPPDGNGTYQADVSHVIIRGHY